MLEKIHTSVNLLNKCHNCSHVFLLVTIIVYALPTHIGADFCLQSHLNFYQISMVSRTFLSELLISCLKFCKNIVKPHGNKDLNATFKNNSNPMWHCFSRVQIFPTSFIYLQFTIYYGVRVGTRVIHHFFKQAQNETAVLNVFQDLRLFQAKNKLKQPSTADWPILVASQPSRAELEQPQFWSNFSDILNLRS